MRWAEEKMKRETRLSVFPVHSSVTGSEPLLEPEWVSGIDHLQLNCLYLQRKKSRSTTSCKVAEPRQHPSLLPPGPGVSLPHHAARDDSQKPL